MSALVLFERSLGGSGDLDVREFGQYCASRVESGLSSYLVAMTSFYRRIPQRTLLGIGPPCIMGRLLNTDRCTLAGLAEETDGQRCLRSHSLVRSGRSQRSPCGRCSTIALRSWGMSSCCTEFANMERVSLAREEKH